MGTEAGKREKRILVITHQLSRTGAPIVLLDMIRCYRRQGYQLEVITMLDGELRQELHALGISVRVQEHFIAEAEEFLRYAGSFQMVVANTLITFEAVQLLKYTEIPVLWWLHEGRQYFEHFRTVLPDLAELPGNIHVFAVGHYVREVIEELYGVRTEILHFGVEDLSGKEKAAGDAKELPDQGKTTIYKGADTGKVRFLTAGTYSRMKGQDILAEAIRRLPQEYLARMEFYFCGNEQIYDETVFYPVKKLSEEYENVTLLHQLSRGQTLEWMERCDCLIVPSRIDPVPTVAVEMMMKENLCLCTEVCGVAHYIRDGFNGFTVPSEDVSALVEKIKYIADNNSGLDVVGKEGRNIYEEYFSMDVFESRIIALANCYMEEEMEEDEEKRMGLATVIITTYNQSDVLLRCLEWLKEVSGIANIVIVDNGSTDGTSDLLAEMGYDFIYFDEGIQGYAKVWNAAIENFPMEDVVVFLEPGYLPGKECFLRMIEVLEQEDCGMVGPVGNGLSAIQYYAIQSAEDLPVMETELQKSGSSAICSLSIGSGLWAASRKVLHENGAFDEELSAAKNVLADFELRMVQKGYQPMICHHALAFCISETAPYTDNANLSGRCDRDVLKNKWEMNYFNFMPHINLIGMIEIERDAPVRVLEVGCDLGVSLLEIKNRFPNSQVYGLEINPASAGIANHFAEVAVGNIEDRQIPFDGKFDYIIFGDVLEHLHDPQGIVRFCRDLLTEHGYILASIPNLMHVSVMEQLLHGRFAYQDNGLLDRSHIHLFTCYEVQKMFLEEGYILDMLNGTSIAFDAGREALVQKLMEISEGVEEHMYRTYQYLVRAKKV